MAPFRYVVALLVALLSVVVAFNQIKPFTQRTRWVTILSSTSDSTSTPPVNSAPKKEWSKGKKDNASTATSSGASNDKRPDVGTFASAPKDRWMQGVVQSVSNFGIFVRPAGSDATGLVHQSQVPRSLISALKTQVPPPAAGSEKSDVERLFHKGDVLKVRVNSVDVENRKLELSMLPFRENDNEEDDYVVEGRDTEEQEEEDDNDAQDDDEEAFVGESLLLWWKGSPYKPVGGDGEHGVAIMEDEEVQVLKESDAVTAGSMRRMFEIDLREDEADLTSKMFEAEMKELEEEIGELDGLDEDIVDFTMGSVGYVGARRFGSQVSSSSFPSILKQDMEFFKELEAAKVSREGKKADQAELDNILREIESTMQTKPQPKQKEDFTATPTINTEAAPVMADANAE